jgi:hypothetical protein
MDVLFECRAVGGTLQPLDDESLELRYLAPEELPDLPLCYPRHLFEARRQTGPPYFRWEDGWLEMD